MESFVKGAGGFSGFGFWKNQNPRLDLETSLSEHEHIQPCKMYNADLWNQQLMPETVLSMMFKCKRPGTLHNILKLKKSPTGEISLNPKP